MPKDPDINPPEFTHDKKWTFAELKEVTASDCETVAKSIMELAGKIREGNFQAFEEFWLEGGTAEGDAKIFQVREMLIIRYAYKKENQKS